MALSREDFFESIESQGLALTFDDVRLITGPSDVSVGEVSKVSRFSANTELQTPLISAAMDTVTESSMAIAMAKLGGLGVLHAGLTPQQQGKEARRVKHELNSCIADPITVKPDQTLESVLTLCDEREFRFRTFPVVDSNDRLIGLLTQNDFDFGESTTLVEDTMTPVNEIITGSPGTTTQQALQLMKQNKKKTVPLIDAQGRIQGLYVWSDVDRHGKGNPEGYNLDASGRLIVAAAVPTDEGALQRIEQMDGYVDAVVIDSAQGDSKYSFETLRMIKSHYPNLEVVVGNISSAESAVDLARRGADGIKVGQGPGSICTTRIETGIGMPQVTAVYESAKAIKDAGHNVPVCADGGIVNRGDVSLAIAAGASSVMMGSVFAGTAEAPGEQITLNGKTVKLYRGMGSASAMRDSASSRERYGVDLKQGVPLAEGVESYVDYKGPVDDVVNMLVKALCKSMSYVGSPDIEAHRSETRFARITNAGRQESGAHDVTVVKK